MCFRCLDNSICWCSSICVTLLFCFNPIVVTFFYFSFPPRIAIGYFAGKDQLWHVSEVFLINLNLNLMVFVGDLWCWPKGSPPLGKRLRLRRSRSRQIRYTCAIRPNCKVLNTVCDFQSRTKFVFSEHETKMIFHTRQEFHSDWKPEWIHSGMTYTGDGMNSFQNESHDHSGIMWILSL